MAGQRGSAPDSPASPLLQDFWGVIPAGGAGTRLWPLSRQASPKFLHDLTGSGHSLLQDAVERLHPLCADNLLVVTGAAHAEEVRRSLAELPDDRVLVEPSARDSLPAIGLAAAVLEREHPQAVLGSFAADHVIADNNRFAELVQRAVAVAREHRLVTLGITPTYPATGFGYLRLGGAYRPAQHEGVHIVEAFVEKPPLDVAREYLESGLLWNAGMFVVRVGLLMSMIERWQPDLAAGLRAVAENPGRIQDVWPLLPALSIDRAIAEPAAGAGEVVVVSADFGWDDVGDFASLANQWQERASHPGLRILGSTEMVFGYESSGIVAAQGGRAVVTLGVPNVVIIDTTDALLVTTRERVQDVKQIVQALRDSGREDLV
ncbi:MAG: mannose-1-phosphate guanylyltransferase [Ornithinimicrobium sp.]